MSYAILRIAKITNKLVKISSTDSTDFFTKLVPNPVENTEIQEEKIKKSKGSSIMPKK